MSCRDGDLDGVVKAIKEGADINNKDGALSRSPLIFVAEFSQNIEIIKNLISKNADINYKDDKNDSALSCLVRSNNVEGVKVLLENSADLNDPCVIDNIFIDSDNENHQLFELLLEYGLDFTKNYAKENTYCVGSEMLIKCIESNNLDMINKLIKAGVNIEYLDRHSYTPLMLASEYGLLEIIQLLVDNNANVNNGNKSQVMPIMLAAHFGHLSVVKCLVNNEADFKAKDSDGWDSKKYAFEGEKDNADIITYLDHLI